MMKKIKPLGAFMLVLSGLLMFVVALLLHRWEFIGWGLFQIFIAMALTERMAFCRKFGAFGILFGGIIMLIISADGRNTYSFVFSIIMLNIGIMFLTRKPNESESI
ncbi:hypothetical protein [Thermococcus paralvinellae]|uniref:hypothetical protein n=1 Tax=Thermococcus paralvinellae TaxID=582419 RepID=UPI0005B28BC7|nr:hypothetical protein [Thermococcus paralvinellae]